MNYSGAVALSDSPRRARGVVVDRRSEPRSHITTDRGTELPPWAGPTIQRIVHLLELAPNWDSYGAAPIRFSAAEAMIDVLSMVLPPNAVPPTIVPSSSGHLQAEWHVNGVDLEVEVVTPSLVFVAYEDDNDEWDVQLSTDLTRLGAVVDRITARE